MFVFITPLKSCDTTQSWAQTQWLLDAALRLACRALFGVEVTEEHRREFGLYRQNSPLPV